MQNTFLQVQRYIEKIYSAICNNIPVKITLKYCNCPQIKNFTVLNTVPVNSIAYCRLNNCMQFLLQGLELLLTKKCLLSSRNSEQINRLLSKHVKITII